MAGSLVLLGAAGCGKDDGDDTTRTAVDLSDVEFTGDPIKVMTLSPYDNAAADYKDPITVAQVAADQINLDGGINGHKVEVITCNDGADPNAAAACARKAKAQKVSALVGGTSFNPDVIMPILEEAGIPWLSSPAVGALDASSKYSFPLVAGSLAFGGTAQKAVDDGCESIAVVRADVPVAAGVVDIVDGVLAQNGAEPSTDIAVPPTATSFDSVAAEIAESDCAISLLISQGLLGTAAALRASGADTQLYTPPSAMTTPIMEQGGEALEGTITSTSFPVASDPIWDEAKAAAPESIDWAYIYTQSTWVGYQVLADVLKDAKTVDADGVFKALSSASHVDTGGFTPTLDFTKELPVPGANRIFNPTTIYNRVEGGQLVPDGDPVDLSAGLG